MNDTMITASDVSSCLTSSEKVKKCARELIQSGGDFISIHPFHTDKALELDLMEQRPTFPGCFGLDARSPNRAFWQSKTFEKYAVDSVPTIVTIGADGRIISYRFPDRWDWKQLFKTDPAKVKPDPIRETRPLKCSPDSWQATQLEPGSCSSQTTFLYRPDTPELKISSMRCASPDICISVKKHMQDGQTLYELSGETGPLRWNSQIVATIFLELSQHGKEIKLDIPIKVSSKSFVEYSKHVYLGLVASNEAVTKKIVIRSNVDRQLLTIRRLNIPDGIKIGLPQTMMTGCGSIPLEIVRGPIDKLGLHKDIVTLEVLLGGQASSQIIELSCTAVSGVIDEKCFVTMGCDPGLVSQFFDGTYAVQQALARRPQLDLIHQVQQLNAFAIVSSGRCLVVVTGHGHLFQFAYTHRPPW